MMKNKTINVYNSLRDTTRRMGDNYDGQLPLFGEKQSYENDTKYWLFSDLYNIFGSHHVGHHNDIASTLQSAITFSNFRQLPKKAADNLPRPESFHDFFAGHMIPIINNYNIYEPVSDTTSIKYNGPDAQLSQYACWSLMKHWPSMIFAQFYFMMPDVSFDILYNMAYKFSRIYHRDRLTNFERMANGIAFRNNVNMREFNASMHRAFFYSTDIEKLKSVYEISGSPLDYMGTRSLIARTRALDNAISAMDNSVNMSFDMFHKILTDELTIARVKMIQKTGRAPEQDLSSKPVSELKKDLNAIEKQFIKQFAFQSLR